MRQYFICFSLMMKRILKRPAFLVLLLMIPFIAIGLNQLEQGEQSGVAVGIVIEKELGGKALSKETDSETNSETDSEVNLEMESEMDSEAAWREEFWKLLQEQEGLLEFCKYDSSDMLIQAVEKEELDCGFVLSANFMEKVLEDEWQKFVICYETSASTATEFAKERIAYAVFTLYAEESYVNYVEQTDAFANAEKNGIKRADIVRFAKEAYQSHLADGSTFSFEYQGEVNQNLSMQEKQEDAQNMQHTQERFPVRGVLAVCIFLSGMCGLLIDWNDRQEKRFARICPVWMTTVVNVWMPTIYTSFISLITLGLLGKLENVGKEIGSLFVYQFLLITYCSIIRLVLRRQETIAVAIPILTLASIVCCPVFIRLATYLPMFRVVEKLFPVTYYLLM
ncbi:MAG: hypothetical protein J6B68_03850 [Lachnospiraceae bacterium]|nr:hypothetical protein [Lachnospiraceae bacterium]